MAGCKSQQPPPPPQQVPPTEEQMEPQEHDVQEHEDNEEGPEDVYEEGQFVVARYDERYYVGKICEVDMEDGLPYHINFMEQKRKAFQWPSRADELWCSSSDIMFQIEEPVPSGKSKRLFKLSVTDLKRMEAL